MNLFGLMPCKNEAWTIGLSARAALGWCNELVILDHGSTDGSDQIIARLDIEYPGRITARFITDSVWDEMKHRQFMLDEARIYGATHIAMIDCDEILTGNLIPEIRGRIERLPDGGMLQLPGYNLRGSLTRYHNNGVWGQRWFSTAFKDHPAVYWGGDKHHSREPEGIKWNSFRPVSQGVGGVLHLWGSSERRLIAKHALYKVRDTIRWPEKLDKHEREYSWAIKGDTQPPYEHFGTPKTWTYADVPDNWWFGYKELMHHLHLDAEPWQEQECRRLVAEHGPLTFKGLDLFGVA